MLLLLLPWHSSCPIELEAKSYSSEIEVDGDGEDWGEGSPWYSHPNVPHLSFRQRIEHDALLLLLEGADLKQQASVGAVELHFRPLVSALTDPAVVFVLRGTSSGWELLAEELVSRKCSGALSFDVATDEAVEVSIPLSHFLQVLPTPRLPGVTIRVKLYFYDEYGEQLYMWYLPSFLL